MVRIAAALALMFGLTSAGLASKKENVKMINKTGKKCKIEVFGGEKDEKTIEDTLEAGETGSTEVEWCPTKFKATCGDSEYEDQITCKELEGDESLEVTFE